LAAGATKSKEIGRFSSADSLQRTALRVRPMFELNHPSRIFKDIFQSQGTHQFILNVLIPTSSYLQFSEAERLKLSNQKDLLIRDLEIQDPTSSARLMNATLISGSW
jgi:hypothetical protein